MKGSIAASITGAVAVIAIGIGIFYFGGVDLFKTSRCTSPIEVTHLQDLIKKGMNGTGMRISKLGKNDEISFYLSELAPKMTTDAEVHKEGHAYYQILSGEGLLHSGTLGKEKEDGQTPPITWFTDVTIKGGDFIDIKPNLVNQIENSSDENLVYLIIAPTDKNGEDVQTVEGYDPSKSRCTKK